MRVHLLALIANIVAGSTAAKDKADDGLALGSNKSPADIEKEAQELEEILEGKWNENQPFFFYDMTHTSNLLRIAKDITIQLNRASLKAWEIEHKQEMAVKERYAGELKESTRELKNLRERNETLKNLSESIMANVKGDLDRLSIAMGKDEAKQVKKENEIKAGPVNQRVRMFQDKIDQEQSPKEPMGRKSVKAS